MQKYEDYYKKVLHKSANHISISQKVVVKHKITTIFFNNSDVFICIFAAIMKNILRVDTPNVYARFVDAQGEKGSSDLLKRFHDLLQQYFRENRQLTKGLPTVTWCASELAYSPRYLGTRMFKRITGLTPTEFLGK